MGIIICREFICVGGSLIHWEEVGKCVEEVEEKEEWVLLGSSFHLLYYNIPV